MPTVIEEKAKEIADYIIAAVVAFLGSSTFYALVKALTNKGIKALQDKVKELEEQNKISKEAKEEYEKEIKKLNKTLNDATEKMDVVLTAITEYLEVNEEKQKEAALLLEKLLPPLNEDENKKDGE